MTKKYAAYVPYIVHVRVEVEADSEDEARDFAYDEAVISGYCGNGGTDKLIGVTGDASIDVGEVAEGNFTLEIDLEELPNE